MAKATQEEAAVRDVPADVPDKNIGADPQSNLQTLKVDASDVPDVEPGHAGPEKLGRAARPDPNAALRKARGVGPGLQDSEIINPAVWVDVDSDAARKAAADAEVARAERHLEQARSRAQAIRKGEPLDNEAGARRLV